MRFCTTTALANDATALASEVEKALRQHAIAQTEQGTIWAYEVDGYGSQLLMDDANVPSLLGLPYLGSSPDAALYARTRAFCWSERNPWFFRGTAGEGIGGPHVGKDMIWPMSQIIYAFTSTDDAEIRRRARMLKGSAKRLRVHARELLQGRPAPLHPRVVCVGQHAVRRVDRGPDCPSSCAVAGLSSH